MSVTSGRILSGVFFALILVCCAVSVDADASKSSVSSRSTIARNFGNLPLSFEPNQGQASARVKYLAHGPGYTLALSPSEATLVFTHVTPPPALQTASKRPELKSLIPKTEARTIGFRMLGRSARRKSTASISCRASATTLSATTARSGNATFRTMPRSATVSLSGC